MSGTTSPAPSPRIVVGVDGSAHGWAALGWAAAHASELGAPLHLIHAFAPDIPMLGFGSTDQDALDGEARRLLATAIARAHAVDAQLTVTTSLPHGFASRSLVAASRDASLVVLGAVGHGLFSRATIGAVAQQVAAHAACPVVIVGHEGRTEPRHHRVAVGVDGSPASVAALHAAFDAAARDDSELVVIHAWEAKGPEDPTLGTGSSWPAYELHLEHAVGRAISSRSAQHPAVKVTHEVVRSAPVAALTRAADEADLVVVGARGTGGFPGLHLGSVSNALLGRTASPLVVVHAREP
ncbi:nucleotide-binding universal stress UspA family protein [Knoellia remsis]|uniref:Nucleotide-binding universal stress UspA family protein n=1 Tax=Knoellia remsis TaxID=407159 RepID=A0A2T0UDP5_9MICO|nr:universal stress protein [Knoellia remsis]PRY56060.1 nucleotide-binding universal stress UspA family protein [Knoellia remsis]